MLMHQQGEMCNVCHSAAEDSEEKRSRVAARLESSHVSVAGYYFIFISFSDFTKMSLEGCIVCHSGTLHGFPFFK